MIWYLFANHFGVHVDPRGNGNVENISIFSLIRFDAWNRLHCWYLDYKTVNHLGAQFIIFSVFIAVLRFVFLEKWAIVMWIFLLKYFNQWFLKSNWGTFISYLNKVVQHWFIKWHHIYVEMKKSFFLKPCLTVILLCLGSNGNGKVTINI